MELKCEATGHDAPLRIQDTKHQRGYSTLHTREDTGHDAPERTKQGSSDSSSWQTCLASSSLLFCQDFKDSPGGTLCASPAVFSFTPSLSSTLYLPTLSLVHLNNLYPFSLFHTVPSLSLSIQAQKVTFVRSTPSVVHSIENHTISILKYPGMQNIAKD